MSLLSATGSALWPFFLVVILAVGILLTAVVGAMLLGRQRLAASHRNYARRLLVVRDQERRLVAGEVHSEMVQRVVAIRNELSSWRRSANPPTPATMAQLEGHLTTLVEGLRQLAHRLHPSVAEHHGLRVALTGLQQELLDAHQFTVTIRQDGAEPPRGDRGHTIYRIIQEALLNVVRHAGVAQAEVRVTTSDDRVAFEVEDRGSGFDQTTAAGRGQSGLGLISMRERAEHAGGTLDIHSRPGSGTLVRGQVPLEDR